RVIGRARLNGLTVLTVQAGDRVFDAAGAGEAGPGTPADLRAGSRVRLTGVCDVQSGWSSARATFVLHLPPDGGVEVLEPAPWWTVERAILWLEVAGLVTLVAGAWVVLLRRRVRQQTELIRNRLEHEAALEARYRDLFENAGDVILTADPD